MWEFWSTCKYKPPCLHLGICRCILYLLYGIWYVECIMCFVGILKYSPPCSYLGIATEAISDLGGSAAKYHAQPSSDIVMIIMVVVYDDDDGHNGHGHGDDDEATCENVGPLLILLSPSGHSWTLLQKFEFGSNQFEHFCKHLKIGMLIRLNNQNIWTLGHYFFGEKTLNIFIELTIVENISTCHLCVWVEGWKAGRRVGTLVGHLR